MDGAVVIIRDAGDLCEGCLAGEGIHDGADAVFGFALDTDLRVMFVEALDGEKSEVGSSQHERDVGIMVFDYSCDSFRGVAADVTTIDRHTHDVDVRECSSDGVFRCVLGCAVDDGHMVAVVFQHPGEIEESEGWDESADGNFNGFGDSELCVRRVDKKDIHGVVTPFQRLRARTRDDGPSVIDPPSSLKQ